MIEASVLLPLFRSKYIAWLQLESLCRQQFVTFEWELIIAEELEDETFSEAQIKHYQPRLEQLGCTRLEYIPLKTWITLGAKWKMLIQGSSSSSKLFFPSAADIYSPPQRLDRLYHLYNKHPEGDWFIPATAIDYDIKTGKAVMRDLVKMKIISKPDVASLAVTSTLFRDAAKIFKVEPMMTLVDGRIWQYCKSLKPKGMNIIRDFSDMWQFGLNVSGLGNISDRTAIFEPGFSSLYLPYPYDLSVTIPKDILFRLKNCRQFLTLHTRKVPPY